MGSNNKFGGLGIRSEGLVQIKHKELESETSSIDCPRSSVLRSALELSANACEGGIIAVCVVWAGGGIAALEISNC